jgi:hypothetical protein
MYYRVDSTNRATDLPPVRAPHNFGVSKTWYEQIQQEPKWKRFLAESKWMKWTNPDGWEPSGNEESENQDSDEHDEHNE